MWLCSSSVSSTVFGFADLLWIFGTWLFRITESCLNLIFLACCVIGLLFWNGPLPGGWWLELLPSSNPPEGEFNELQERDGVRSFGEGLTLAGRLKLFPALSSSLKFSGSSFTLESLILSFCYGWKAVPKQRTTKLYFWSKRRLMVLKRKAGACDPAFFWHSSIFQDWFLCTHQLFYGCQIHQVFHLCYCLKLHINL